MKAYIIGIIAVIVIGGGGYLALHKSSPAKSSSSSYSSSSNSSSKTATSSGAIIETKTDKNVGQYLADSNGQALYTYGSDKSGVSNCTGSCLYNWPAYTTTSTTESSLPPNVSIIKRSDDGTNQYAYKGLPLYTFTSDNVGQVTGDGTEGFHVAKP